MTKRTRVGQSCSYFSMYLGCCFSPLISPSAVGKGFPADGKINSSGLVLLPAVHGKHLCCPLTRFPLGWQIIPVCLGLRSRKQNEQCEASSVKPRSTGHPPPYSHLTPSGSSPLPLPTHTHYVTNTIYSFLPANNTAKSFANAEMYKERQNTHAHYLTIMQG